MVHHILSVHHLIGHLTWQEFHHAEVIVVSCGQRVAVRGWCLPRELWRHRIQVCHTQIVGVEAIAGKGREERRCLGLVADLEECRASGWSTDYKWFRAVEIPSVGRQADPIVSFRQQAEGAVHVVVKEIQRSGNLAQRNMVEKSPNLGRRKLTGTTGGHDDGQLGLALRRHADRQFAGWNNLLQLHHQIDVLINIRVIGEGDIEIVRRVHDIEHQLRRQDFLNRSDGNHHFLGVEREDANQRGQQCCYGFS